MPDPHLNHPNDAEMEAMISAWKDRGGQVQRLKATKARRGPLPSPWDTIAADAHVIVLDDGPPSPRRTRT